jgi:hypothetical protein
MRLPRHGNAVTCMRLAPDGASIIVGRGLHSSTIQLNLSRF